MSDGRVTVTAAPADDGAAIAASAGAAVVAIGVPVVESAEGPHLLPGAPASIAVGGVEVSLGPDAEVCRRRGFTGAVGEVLTALGTGAAPTTVWVGCGRQHQVDLEAVRRAAAAFVRAAGRSGAAVFVLPASLADAAAGGDSPSAPSSDAHRHGAQAVAEGLVLAGYRFGAHKSEDVEGRVDAVVVAGAGFDGADLAAAVARGVRIADAVCFARDLVNEPPSTMTPTRLAEVAQAVLGGQSAVTVEVWDEQRVVEERLGGLLGVARGSAEPPRLVRASYEPPGGKGEVPHVVLVGKGITFDSGGLSLKTAEGMVTMKTDMSGAATVLAALSACQDLGIEVRVTAIAPVTENMPGGRATKPGDVLTIRSGRTIEVLNTDAEGRLVLADGLTLATELHPDAIVDLATLTGAQVVALGSSIAALFSNNDPLADRVLAASARAGEPMWRLPLADQYQSHIDSDVADMKNIGKPGQAGAIAAALLLARFVGEAPWVHVDMAGPARSDEDTGIFAKGGTGFGVRTLLELLGSYRPA